MDPYTAKELAQEWVRFAGRLKGDPYGFDHARHGSERAEEVLISELVARVPSQAITQVVSDRGGNPRILSVDAHGHLLREIGFRPIPSSPDGEPTMIPANDAVRTVSRVLVLDPASASCTTDTFWVGRPQERWRNTRWVFQFGAHEVAFSTEEADEASELSGERIVEAIFLALNWGSPVTEPLREVA